MKDGTDKSDIAPESALAGVTPADDGASETPEKKDKKCGVRKSLRIAFNIAAGFGAAAATKGLVATVAATLSAPPLAAAIGGVVLASAAVGLAMGATHYLYGKSDAKKAGADAPGFWSDENKKVMKKSTLWALVGGALFLGFDQVVSNYFGVGAPTPQGPDIETGGNDGIKLPEPGLETGVDKIITGPEQLDGGQTDLTETGDTGLLDDTTAGDALTGNDTFDPQGGETAEQTFVPPVAETVNTCVAPMDRFAEVMANSDVSDRVRDAVERAASTNEAVAAQGQKDIAYFLFNGFDGVPQDRSLALELFYQAAEHGNQQANIDLLYSQYHGLAGLEAQPESALSAMQGVENSARASWFTDQWSQATTPANTDSFVDVREQVRQLYPCLSK